MRHRVSGLLWRAIEPWGPPQGDAVESLLHDVQRCRAQAAILGPRLAEHLFGPLAASGVEAVAFKGATLRDRYPDPALRPMDDVDLLLPQSRHREALAALGRAGWRVLPQADPDHETVLAHPSLPGLPLELHSRMAAPEQAGTRLDLERLWTTRQEAPVAGTPGFVLAPEAELVCLAAHAAKPFHTFDRMIWSVDAAVVAAGLEAPDWEGVEAAAADACCRSALAVALTHAGRLGADSPAALRRVHARGARRNALAPLLGEDWPVIEADPGLRNRLAFALIDDRRLRAMRALRDVTAMGPLHAPGRAATIARRLARRWWSLRGRGPQSGGRISPSSTSRS